MSNHDDLQPVIDQLRASRPEATALELDAIKQRVRARASHPARRRTRRAELMKSRLVILTMLVFGMLLSTAGAGLAISGVSGNAAQNTYPKSSTPAGGGVLGQEDEGGGSGVSPEGNDVSPQGSDVSPQGSDVSPQGGSSATQPSRQVEAGTTASGKSLPFTGFAAIPILFGGLVLLGSGLVLRSRAGQN